MLTLECPKCGERELITPINTVVSQLKDMEIKCQCGFKGTPKFVVTDCEG